MPSIASQKLKIDNWGEESDKLNFSKLWERKKKHDSILLVSVSKVTFKKLFKKFSPLVKYWKQIW